MGLLKQKRKANIYVEVRLESDNSVIRRADMTDKTDEFIKNFNVYINKLIDHEKHFVFIHESESILKDI